MWKKLGIGALIVLACVVLLGKTEAGQKVTSFAGLYWKKANKGVNEAVPLEVEVERLKMELTKRNKVMEKAITAYAEEQVAVKRMEKDIAASKVNLEKQWLLITTMREDVNSGSQFIVYDTKKYSVERIKQKLANDFQVYEKCEAELKDREKLLEQKLAGLETAERQIAEMKGEYKKLEVELAQIETQVKALRLAQQRSKFQLDDSHLAKVKGDIRRLQDRVEAQVLETTMKDQYVADPEIKVERKVETVDALKRLEDRIGAKVAEGK